MYRDAEKIRDGQRKESRSFKVEQFARVNEQQTERAEQARLDRPEAPATAPVSTWDLTSIAAVVVPGLALLIIALA